jgi:hypothetical protein
MTIKFICTCGKHLRARDEMAMRRSICPRCGSPVGIPALNPTHRGATLGPMTPAERMRKNRSGPSGRSADSSREVPDAKKRSANSLSAGSQEDPLRRLLSEHIASLLNPAARQPRQLEKHWYQCLLYPVRVGVLVIGLAGALTALSGGTLLALPHMVELRFQFSGLLILAGLYLVIPLTIIGFACLVLEGALKTVPVGTLEVHWVWRSVGLALRSLLTWLVCLLVGPILPVGGSLLYWFYYGDPAPIDWLILADLTILGLGYGLFALLAVSQSDRLIDANPICVADLVYRLGFRSVVIAFITVVLVIAHGALAVIALQQLEDDPGLGWTLLFCCWLNGLFWVAFFLRLLGVWCKQTEVRGQRSEIRGQRSEAMAARDQAKFTGKGFGSRGDEHGAL